MNELKLINLILVTLIREDPALDMCDHYIRILWLNIFLRIRH